MLTIQDLTRADLENMLSRLTQHNKENEMLVSEMLSTIERDRSGNPLHAKEAFEHLAQGFKESAAVTGKAFVKTGIKGFDKMVRAVGAAVREARH